MSLFRVGVRGLLLRPRTLALGAIPVCTALVALVVLFSTDSSNIDDAYAGMTGLLLVPLVVAFVSLIMGVSAFTDDREDGTLLLLMATPLRRWAIVASKLGSAWLTVLVVCLPAVITCILLGGRSSAGWGKAVAATLISVLLTSAAYTSVFVLLSLFTRRAVLIGSLYIVLWEGTVAGLASSADELSIGAYGRTIVAGSIASDALKTAADVSVATAVIVLVCVTAAAFGLASWRLPRSPMR